LKVLVIMRNLLNRKRTIIILIFVVVVLAAAFLLVNTFINNLTESKDISEIQSAVAEYNVEYKSERGFGNDRFDIYSFSLKIKLEDLEFLPKDNDLQKIYKTSFETLSDLELGNNDDGLKTEIEKLIEASDLKYRYIHMGGTEKLYLFSDDVNKGYCLILTI